MTDHRDIVAIGASAGGVEALQTLVAGLPAGFPGAVLVVLHLPREAPSALPGILDRAGPLSAATADDLLDAEVRMSELGSLTSDELTVPASGYGCPSCGGALFQFPAGPVPRFRCRVGHAWSAESLLDEQAIALEGALRMALRALEEKSALSRRMASHRTGGDRFRDVAAEAEAAGAVIRQLINQIG